MYFFTKLISLDIHFGIGNKIRKNERVRTHNVVEYSNM